MSETKTQNILNKFKILSGSMLKLIAIISMIVDHTGLILFSESISMHMPFLTVGSFQISGYYLMRRIGRLAFPIFCFLLTEGTYIPRIKDDTRSLFCFLPLYRKYRLT